MTELDWIKLIIINCVKKTRIAHYSLPFPRFSQYLRTWEEVGTIKTGKDGKIGDLEVTCILVGYASNQEGDCYRMLNPKTKMVSETHDVVFLNRMYFKAPKNTKKSHKKQDPDNTDLESVQQDKRGGGL
jgi:hypothetical protein